MSWSRRHDACIECGSADHKHFGKGLCAICYKRRWVAASSKRPWSKQHSCCVRCGRTDARHASNGLCNRCYQADCLATENGKLAQRRYAARYNAAPHGREKRRAYSALPSTNDRKRRWNRRRRELEQGFDVQLPPFYDAVILDAFGQRCAACGDHRHLELDHHRPLQDGHPLLHNSVPLCRSCNSKKHKKSPQVFYDQRVLLEIEERLAALRESFEEWQELSCWA